jgi:hypothetical protein
VSLLRTDHRPRVEFYVRHGLVPKSPTDEQIGRAFEAIRNRVGMMVQVRYYLQHPKMMFPTAQKRAALRQDIREIARDGYKPPHEVAAIEGVDTRPLLDRSLERLFLFSPARLAAQCLFNPYAAIPSDGLNAPRRFLIAHILHTTHPPPAIWDLQVLHPDEGALEELSDRLDRAMRGAGFRARVDRALGCRQGYFEYLREWIPRIKRFEYPEVPRGLNPLGENLVAFLNYAATL